MRAEGVAQDVPPDLPQPGTPAAPPEHRVDLGTVPHLPRGMAEDEAPAEMPNRLEHRGEPPRHVDRPRAPALRHTDLTAPVCLAYGQPVRLEVDILPFQ